MSAPDNKNGKYKSVAPDTLPKSDEGKSLVDLYVHLPSSKKYVKWVPKGENVDPKQVQKLKEHVDPNFYAENVIEIKAEPATIEEVKVFTVDTEVEREDLVFKGEKSEDYEAAHLVAVQGEKKEIEHEQITIVHGTQHLDNIKQLFGSSAAESLTEPIDDKLKDIYKDIGVGKPGSFTLQDSKLNEMSEKICNAISPEIGDVRSHLKNIPAFVSIMDESAAISTLAILFAIAQGQKAKGVFKDLSYACLLMDISLVGSPPDLKKRWMLDPDSLTDAERIIIESHPRKSETVVMEKFKSIPEIVGQMILGHHELFNGRGFPRKVRSDLLPPVVRVLAFAVDVHLHMKRAELKGQVLGVESVVESFMDTSLEPHLRRHNIDLCRKIMKYMAEGEPT